MSDAYLTYKEMRQLDSFEERFEYLKQGALIGDETFGHSRYLNQTLYRSPEWKAIRREVILRDSGCDLGCDDRPIYGKIVIHHLNPITEEDIVNRADCLFDLNNLICTTHETHNAIHYGDINLLTPSKPIERHAGDTTLW